MFKKREDNKERKAEDNSREKKIDVVSKTHTGSSSVLFKKRNDTSEHSSKEGFIMPKRVPLKEDDYNTKSYRKDQKSSDKPIKKETHERSVFEE